MTRRVAAAVLFPLPQVPEQAGRLRGCVVERGELEEDRGALRHCESREVNLSWDTKKKRRDNCHASQH